MQEHFKSNHYFADFLMHVIEKSNGFDLPEKQIKEIISYIIESTNYLKQYS